jgi:proton glutamate symport protein
MDMCRTSVNLLGNCVATAVVARWEGVPLQPRPSDVLEVEAIG